MTLQKVIDELNIHKQEIERVIAKLEQFLGNDSDILNSRHRQDTQSIGPHLMPKLPIQRHRQRGWPEKDCTETETPSRRKSE